MPAWSIRVTPLYWKIGDQVDSARTSLPAGAACCVLRDGVVERACRWGSGAAPCVTPSGPVGANQRRSSLQAPGSRLQAPGSGIQAPGPRLRDPGSRPEAPGSRLQAHTEVIENGSGPQVDGGHDVLVAPAELQGRSSVPGQGAGGLQSLVPPRPRVLRVLLPLPPKRKFCENAAHI